MLAVVVMRLVRLVVRYLSSQVFSVSSCRHYRGADILLDPRTVLTVH